MALLVNSALFRVDITFFGRVVRVFQVITVARQHIYDNNNVVIRHESVIRRGAYLNRASCLIVLRASHQRKIGGGRDIFFNPFESSGSRLNHYKNVGGVVSVRAYTRGHTGGR